MCSINKLHCAHCFCFIDNKGNEVMSYFMKENDFEVSHDVLNYDCSLGLIRLV